MDKFPFAFTLKYIATQKTRFTIGYSQFLAHFSLQCRGDILAKVHMPADGGVPLAGLYGFPQWTVLQIEPSL